MVNGSAPTSPASIPAVNGVTLLIRALTASEPEQAYDAWRQWCSVADLDSLPWESAQIIPALGGRLWTWLRDDPGAGILRGIVRRAWSEAQIRLTASHGAIELLERAGCGPVLLAGPALVSLLNQREGSVRPIPFLRLVVRRDRLHQAAAALESDGWRLSGALPVTGSNKAFDGTNHVFYSRNDVIILLHWRLLPIHGPWVAAGEAEFIEHSRWVTSGGLHTLIPGPEHTLLDALSDRTNSNLDVVPWQVDAALLPLADICWSKWRELASTYAPEAFDRLDEMRSLGLDVPKLYRPLRHRAARLVRRCLHC